MTRHRPWRARGDSSDGDHAWRSRDARAPAGQEIAGPLAMPELVGIHGTCRTQRRSSNDPHSRLEMAAVGPLSRIATRPRLRPRRSSSEASAHAYQPPADGPSRRCSFGPVLVNQVGVVLRRRLHTPVALGGCVDPHRLQPIHRPVRSQMKSAATGTVNRATGSVALASGSRCSRGRPSSWAASRTAAGGSSSASTWVARSRRRSSSSMPRGLDGTRGAAAATAIPASKQVARSTPGAITTARRSVRPTPSRTRSPASPPPPPATGERSAPHRERTEPDARAR